MGNISDNVLSHLDNLPESLEILECQNNQLQKLDLQYCQQLKKLIASNNPLLLVEHVPNSIEHMEMENNPFTEILREDGSKKDKKKQNQKINFLDALNEYFKLKNKKKKKRCRKKKKKKKKKKS